MTPKDVPRNATKEELTGLEVHASTSTSGEPSRMANPTPIPAPWYANRMTVLKTSLIAFFPQYYIPTNASTATNTGQSDISVTLSRGYRRTNLITDGDFEKYQCAGGAAFCFTNMTSDWVGTSPRGGNYDASIFHYEYYAYHSTGVGLLGSAYGSDSLSGTLTYAHPIRTKKGEEYKIQFFLQSTYSGKQREQDAFVSVVWNGQIIETFYTGYMPWAYYEVTVRGTGNDGLAFVGGKAPAFTFIDEVYVFRYY
ncbi:hypothetical protein AAF712_009372 [Marasmius tenuissimus]|uniref:Uncharacterized protein n=1 Tax=Marasmius tenuissimus TaxID=585030 RepID=A0ABR2ZQZ4_9AGAR